MLEQLNTFFETIYGNETANLAIAAFFVFGSVIYFIDKNITNKYLITSLLIAGASLTFKYRAMHIDGFSVGIIIGLCLTVVASVSIGGLIGKHNSTKSVEEKKKSETRWFWAEIVGTGLSIILFVFSIMTK